MAVADLDFGDHRAGAPSLVYSPHALEGWLIAGKHRTFLPFSSHVVRGKIK